MFHGENAAAFLPGFAALLGISAGITALPDRLDSPADRAACAAADTAKLMARPQTPASQSFLGAARSRA